MKRITALLLSAVVCAGLLSGCGEKTSGNQSNAGNNNPSSASGSGAQLSGKTLVVGTMAKTMGIPIQYAKEKGYFDEAGLDVEIVIFATGAPINEAMAAKELDVAVSGMASVYALATGNYTYVGDCTIASQGQSIFVRADSDIAKAAGKDGILGSAETINGISILGPTATAAHYNAIQYAECFGLTSSDITVVNMEYAQAYQAFITGEGDAIATTPPYSNQLAADSAFVQAADLTQTSGAALTDAIYVQNEVAGNRSADIQAFLEVYYKASAELMADPAMRAEFGTKWYAEEGITYSEEDMANEIAGNDYTTVDFMNQSSYIFGSTMIHIGDFFVDQGMIESSNYPNIVNSMDTSYVETITGHAVKIAD